MVGWPRSIDRQGAAARLLDRWINRSFDRTGPHTDQHPLNPAHPTPTDDDNSIALPFDKRPTNLDGTLPGDVGFDPVGFSNNPPRPWLIGGEGRSLKWYREAEIVHGRVAMIAALGWVFPNIYHWPGNEEVRGAI